MSTQQPSLKAEMFDYDDDDNALLIEKKKARKRRRKERNHMPEAGELNITAMMDMMTIILVFLLKNYTTTPAANINSELQPPVTSNALPMAEAISITISKTEISVDDKKVLDLKDGLIDPTYKNIPDQILLVPAIRDALLARVEYHKRIEQGGGSAFTGNLLVIGDKSISYELLAEVLYSAGQAQLANYKFVAIGL